MSINEEINNEIIRLEGIINRSLTNANYTNKSEEHYILINFDGNCDGIYYITYHIQIGEMVLAYRIITTAHVAVNVARLECLKEFMADLMFYGLFSVCARTLKKIEEISVLDYFTKKQKYE